MTANIDSAEASASNRIAASTPTDDSDVRFVIATTYAATPTIQTVHVRQPGVCRAEDDVTCDPSTVGMGSRGRADKSYFPALAVSPKQSAARASVTAVAASAQRA